MRGWKLAVVGLIAGIGVCAAPAPANAIHYYILIETEQAFFRGILPQDWPRHMNMTRYTNAETLRKGISVCHTGVNPPGYGKSFIASAYQSGLCAEVRNNDLAAATAGSGR